FLNQGTHSQLSSILKAENGDGSVLDEFRAPDQNKALDPQIAYEIVSILSDPDARSQVFGFTNLMSIPGHSVAIKTGTTQEFRDAWAIGGSRQITVGVWSGNTNNSPMKKGADGSTVSVPIWNKIMTEILHNWQDEPFETPPGTEKITVEKYSNKLPSEASKDLVTDFFAAWQIPKDKDDVNVAVKVNKITGDLASLLTPADLIEQRTVTKIHSERPNDPNWENPVQQWAQDNGLNQQQAPTQTDQLYTQDRVPTIAITKPKQDDSVQGTLDIAATASANFGVKQVDFAVDNATIATVTTPPYQTSYNTSNLSGGNHVLQATVIDQNGAKASQSITFFVVRGSEVPVVSNVTVTAITSDRATVSWVTSKLGDGQVDYGTSQSHGLTSSLQANNTTEHSIEISGLQSKTTYYYRVRSKDSGGNQAISAVASFTTQ
ncbi:fibronectin type III domain-containing protein, partial [Candidatus Berkelbacteria bacterium]|nr:fibronectin type III domain-containing protein [Candidatus Berkelbacteria bacterium]